MMQQGYFATGGNTGGTGYNNNQGSAPNQGGGDFNTTSYYNPSSGGGY